ncbi:GAF sensor signal transduction histidine kinase [Maribacter vaceletii]|uniref:histidine kinase n=1 Tax=Maribacter vaceletii TaxID=1206816 RepID=A0A495DRX7_9FLAO|nr:GAF domain-containing sensor histidine kinase [Maribacter vaceletii]RKR06481.1 GAF sensor signal transduction histidine kinase [Maribacter vaceletii]
MIAPKDHLYEKERVNALKSYNVLDTLPEEDYDNLTKIAAQICGTPISLVSLLDETRQWFKSRHGIDATETPKELAFCAHAINSDDKIFNIKDAREDERFKENPLVINDPNVIFYAGVSLTNDEGLPLGTLCVIDHKPRTLTQTQKDSLTALSKHVMNLLELRKNRILLEDSNKELALKNTELENFASTTAHDLKAPLNNISSMSELIIESYSDKLEEDGSIMLGFIKTSSDKLKKLIDGLLNYSKTSSLLHSERTTVTITTIIEDLQTLYAFESSVDLVVKTDLKTITINKIALDQILINLVGNAIKYGNKDDLKIIIGVSESKENYHFYVQDNGPGIALNLHDKIFEIFKTVGVKDKYGQQGTGIGLATVKKIVEKLGGTISVESEEGKGAKFIFNITKDTTPNIPLVNYLGASPQGIY